MKRHVRLLSVILTLIFLLWYLFFFSLQTTGGFFLVKNVGSFLPHSLYYIEIDSPYYNNMKILCSESDYHLICEKDYGYYGIEFKRSSLFENLGVVTYMQYDDFLNEKTYSLSQDYRRCEKSDGVD